MSADGKAAWWTSLWFNWAVAWFIQSQFEPQTANSGWVKKGARYLHAVLHGERRRRRAGLVQLCSHAPQHTHQKRRQRAALFLRTPARRAPCRRTLPLTPAGEHQAHLLEALRQHGLLEAVVVVADQRVVRQRLHADVQRHVLRLLRHALQCRAAAGGRQRLQQSRGWGLKVRHALCGRASVWVSRVRVIAAG